MPERIDSEEVFAQLRYAEDARLPGRMKEWLVRLAHDRTKAVHSTHIVHAVHRSPPGGSPVPVYRSDGSIGLRWEPASEPTPPYKRVSRGRALSLRRAMAASPSPIRFLSAAASSGVHA